MLGFHLLLKLYFLGCKIYCRLFALTSFGLQGELDLPTGGLLMAILLSLLSILLCGCKIALRIFQPLVGLCLLLLNGK